jgi:hypothetical protein
MRALCVADKSAKYDVEVKNITIEPYPAVSGEDVTFIVPAIASKCSETFGGFGGGFR